MVPGTPHSVIYREPIRERPVVVGAVGAHCKKFRAAAHEQYVFPICDSQQLSFLREAGDRNSVLQVRFFQFTHIRNPHWLACILPLLVRCICKGPRARKGSLENQKS